MTDINHLIYKEIEHKKTAEKEHRLIIELVESAHNLFLIGADETWAIHENKSDEAFHSVYLLICCKINSDIRTIIHATITGWYGTAIALLREIDDAYLKIIFITNFPDESQLLIDNKINNKSIRKRINRENIKYPLKTKDWGLLSQIKHAELKGIAAYGEERNGETILRYYSIYDSSSVKLLLLATADYLIWILEHLIHFFKCKYNNQFAKSDFIQSYDKLIKDRNGFTIEVK